MYETFYQAVCTLTVLDYSVSLVDTHLVLYLGIYPNLIEGVIATRTLRIKLQERPRHLHVHKHALSQLQPVHS